MTLYIENIVAGYVEGDREVPVLRGVSALAPTGSFTSVMGPSGSGKSTLLRCASGLMGPSSGRVLLDGTDITALSGNDLIRYRRRSMGFVFQSFDLLTALNVQQNVELPLRLDGRRPDRRRTIEMLDIVGLAEFAERSPEQLSGGQRQRVAIARAVVGDPTIVFADEPTGALDINSAANVLRILRSIADSGRTVVMVTHDPVAAATSDRVLFLADGELVDQLSAPTASAVASRMTDLVSAA
ncbi:ABC transporter ATP-binding protein [Rhodococcoides yunnanense]|uniref:ABC transporter ATP-binding protein n=1 Tax=Rhodococcoides yunnanense TaxID=278209 RepID=A0ABU4BEH5_9NOCA|nr:ABC transporter ATP-binding protein [Rhodococcus yunnanensis]MDV6262619.1 ABC transporter ATP-binding protein [Rhodococcus yunnanensis]